MNPRCRAPFAASVQALPLFLRAGGAALPAIALAACSSPSRVTNDAEEAHVESWTEDGTRFTRRVRADGTVETSVACGPDPQWFTFLAAQDADGSWNPAWTPESTVGFAPGAESDRALVTALWTLALVRENARDRRRAVAEGLSWLRATGDAPLDVRSRAAAALAFVHALDSSDLGRHDEFADAAHHAADALEATASPGGGWTDASGRRDASATAWASLALDRAHARGLGDRSATLRRAADAFGTRGADAPDHAIAALLVESRTRPADASGLFGSLERLDPKVEASTAVDPETVLFACVLLAETRDEARGLRFAWSAAADAVSRRLRSGGPLDREVEPWPWRDVGAAGGALATRALGALALQTWLRYGGP